jgi:hypothetical protein
VGALTDELRRNGFVERQNLAIEYRAWAPQMDLVSDYAADLAARPLDVFAVGGPVAVRAVQKATKIMPILAITDDMIGEGVVKSMARPDGNTTGVSILATELNGKWQEILIEGVPGVRRIAALADTATSPPAQLEALQQEAKARGIELSIQRVDKGDEIPAALAAAKLSGAGALNVLASPMSVWPCCGCRPYFNGQSSPKKAGLLPMARALPRSSATSLRVSSCSFSAASKSPIFRSNSRASSSSQSISRPPTHWVSPCRRR